MNRTKTLSVAERITVYLARRRHLGTPWTTATQVCESFGYSGAQPHIEQYLRKLLADGGVQRRPYEGRGRARWEYALVDME
jgi:hypothetical protein